MSIRHISRRRFLGGAAAGLALPYFLRSRASAQERPAPSERITIGCIGVGGMGRANMDAFLNQADAQVVAVCDVDKNHLQAAKDEVDKRYGNTGCAAYADFRELLARPDIDAISLATPDHWHAIPAIMAAESGKDVYGEKPISHNLREGRAMADAVARHGRVWQTGSWQRSSGEFRQACELVRNGRIGRVARIEVGLPTGFASGPVPLEAPPPELDYDFWVGPAAWSPYTRRTHGDWRWNLNFGGGQLMDWIGHHGDIAHWGMGWDLTGPLEIEGSATYPTEGIFDAAITYHYVAKYLGGVEMHVANDGNRSIRSGTRWIGEDGRWVRVDRGVLEAEPKLLLQERIGSTETVLFRSPGHHRNFLDCVKSRQPTITPAEVAHRSASVGHLGQIAMRVGRKLRWDPAREEIIGDAAASRMLGEVPRGSWSL